MRDSIDRIRRLSVTFFWPLALLALPNCSLYEGGTLAPSVNVKQGPSPESDVIFCDIQKPGTDGLHCADQNEQGMGVRLIGGAVALATGKSNNFALDYSNAALTACNNLGPQAVVFEGSFPEGTAVCLNCAAVIPSQHANPLAACIARCADLTDPGVVPPTAQTLASCATRTHLSTNAVLAKPPGCFPNACTATGGFFLKPSDDPRRKSAAVTWVALNGVKTGPDPNTLTRDAPFDNTFDAGASSNETIGSGDAYVQFEATSDLTARLGGLKQGAPSNPPALANLDFAIDLFKGCFYIYENGNPVVPTMPEPTAPTCSVANAVGTYKAGDQFRIVVEGEGDGTKTAKISFEHFPAGLTCVEGQGLCLPISTQDGGKTASYPLRFDSAFRELNASIANVRIVRNQQ